MFVLNFFERETPPRPFVPCFIAIRNGQTKDRYGGHESFILYYYYYKLFVFIYCCLFFFVFCFFRILLIQYYVGDPYRVKCERVFFLSVISKKKKKMFSRHRQKIFANYWQIQGHRNILNNPSML